MFGYIFLSLFILPILARSGFKPDNAPCHRNMECNSDCCIPDLYPNGTVKHYDAHGFPDRICSSFDEWGYNDCDVLNYE